MGKYSATAFALIHMYTEGSGSKAPEGTAEDDSNGGRQSRTQEGKDLLTADATLDDQASAQTVPDLLQKQARRIPKGFSHVLDPGWCRARFKGNKGSQCF
jgi:hypothetical protein